MCQMRILLSELEKSFLGPVDDCLPFEFLQKLEELESDPSPTQIQNFIFSLFGNTKTEIATQICGSETYVKC